jgi:IS1 family transposase
MAARPDEGKANVSNILPLSARVAVIAHLCEGTSIRATVRLTGVSKGAILRLLVLIGIGCALLHDKLVKGIEASIIEGDEIWAFVQKKDKRKTANDPAAWGDAYTWTALDVVSRLLISYLTGKREKYEATAFAHDLRSRIVGRPHLSTDGWGDYLPALLSAFGADGIDYGMSIKEYERSIDRQMAAKHRYSPGRVKSVKRVAVLGEPDLDIVGTSHMERGNLTFRMQQRRFTRLTNAFSKKAANLAHAVSLHVVHYNFVRPHMALGKESAPMTPAMAAGLASRPWTIAELVVAALGAAEEAAEEAGLTPEPSEDEAPATVREPVPWTGDAAGL